ncbi:hypothetical protein ACU4GD_35335 [Cupriavidus basilensis]
MMEYDPAAAVAAIVLLALGPGDGLSASIALPDSSAVRQLP